MTRSDFARRPQSKQARAPQKTVTLVVLAALLPLAACTGGPAPIEAQVKRPPTHGYAKLRIAAHEAGVFLGALDGTDCEAANADFSVRFQTPATINAPLYGYTTQPVRITCDRPGYKSNVVMLPPIDADVFSAAMNRGALGAAVMQAGLGMIPVVGIATGAVGRVAGANIGVASALQEAERLPEEVRRTHHFSYLPALAMEEGAKTVSVALTKTGG